MSSVNVEDIGMDKVGLYSGTFDPVTNGHLDVIERGYELFDRLYITVAQNINKKTLFTVEERVEMLKCATAHLPNVEVMVCSDKLVVDFAKEVGAKTILRGLRAVTDFESEMQIAQTNHSIDPGIDTMFFTTSLEYAFLSSTIVKEVAYYGADISRFVPDAVVKAFEQKAKEKK